MVRPTCLRALVACILVAGCTKPEDAQPNPELKVPDIPKGRTGPGGPVAKPK